ncbi:response regulator [Aromatoleum petrolei]|uniref:Response regulator n=1 Tax=Aromatoleum petrolei TaxID=76116 RepID=A0ABX1MP07_9RHOO|nr:response regulator transcription factor [Aromatoleum petrolei]NMF87774.1 response regulator [Aromatoleum petrolei]QTQ38265.1 Transcriptional regulator, LuxR family [Aromatoleum petrolei]
MRSTLEHLRLALADDHPLVRTGFRMLLEGFGATIVAEAESGEAAFVAYSEHRPDVLIMDVRMPGIGGLGALERLLSHFPNARTLMLSAHDDIQIPTRALKAGATGYLSKRADPQELGRAVAVVARGQRYIDQELAPRIALSKYDGSEDPADALTNREFAVFLELAGGSSVREIARRHSLSSSTVGTHLYHIKQKLNVSNAAELVLIAVRAGVI